MAVARGGTQTGLAARGHSRILGQDSGEAGGLGWRISPVRRQRWGQRKKEKNKTKKTSSKTGGEGAVGGHRTATCVVFPRGFTVKKKKKPEDYTGTALGNPCPPNAYFGRRWEQQAR